MNKLYRTTGDFEQEVFRFRQAILTLAKDKDSEVDVVACAVADVLADVAAAGDRLAGTASINDRLDSFLRRFHETYQKVRNARETLTQENLRGVTLVRHRIDAN